ncbi:MAG: DUF1573 domain-containing protein, partial [Candidatus Sumerlaeaceae bacterium]|nr:DUF1573 domain-containing protein [Candidatus Sumerlaeaceae bacterium]
SAHGVQPQTIIVDLGPVIAGRTETTSILVRNHASVAVSAAHIQSTCGCLRPGLQPGRLQPGEEGLLTVHVRSSNEGLLEEQLTAVAPSNEVAFDVVVRGHARSPVVCEPRIVQQVLYAGRVRRGDVLTSFVISCKPPDHLPVGRIEAVLSSDWLVASVRRINRSAAVCYISVSGVPQLGRLEISPSIQHGVTVLASPVLLLDIYCAVPVEPREVNLGFSAAPAEIERAITVGDTDTTVTEVTLAGFPPGVAKCWIDSDNGGRPQVRVQISVKQPLQVFGCMEMNVLNRNRHVGRIAVPVRGVFQ